MGVEVGKGTRGGSGGTCVGSGGDGEGGGYAGAMCMGISTGRLAVSVLSLGGLEAGAASVVVLGRRPLFGGRGGEGLDKAVPLFIAWESSAGKQRSTKVNGVSAGRPSPAWNKSKGLRTSAQTVSSALLLRGASNQQLVSLPCALPAAKVRAGRAARHTRAGRGNSAPALGWQQMELPQSQHAAKEHRDGWRAPRGCASSIPFAKESETRRAPQTPVVLMVPLHVKEIEIR